MSTPSTTSDVDPAPRRPAKFGGRGAKAAAARKAGASAGKPVARRGEDEELTEAATAAASTPAEPPQVPHQADQAPDRSREPLEGTVYPAESTNPFEYVAAPEGASDLQHLAHAERQLRKVGDAAGEAFASVEYTYWALTGRWLSEVQEKGSYKAGGHKSVEKFAKAVGIERHTYYRAIRHHVVYTALDGLIEKPLAQLVVEQLYSLGKDDPKLLREKYTEMAAEGPVTVSAVRSLRRLLDASAAAAQAPKAIGARQPRPVADRLKEARAAGKIDLGLLKELAEFDKDSARDYVKDLKERLAEAETLLND
ncbi:hypothetical protein E6R60_26175 [Streptomyces sp. A0642]|uniref:hypothetical protein n=1 Tax=Streptomyces sp. A0642 TaxID=2563100 RepID=UPI0010A23774|nr:hypothetical protein [Streptomyces sp. A0642]THA72424.1 hypothetical protein E6R60_26175 [Streptomyces sp. A0642]